MWLCPCECTVCNHDIGGGQKTVSDPQKLDLGRVMTNHMVAWNRSWVLCKSRSAFNAEPSLQLLTFVSYSPPVLYFVPLFSFCFSGGHVMASMWSQSDLQLSLISSHNADSGDWTQVVRLSSKRLYIEPPRRPLSYIFHFRDTRDPFTVYQYSIDCFWRPCWCTSSGDCRCDIRLNNASPTRQVMRGLRTCLG